MSRLRQLLLLVVVLWPASAVWAEPTTRHPSAAAVASAHPLATAAGQRILDEGGNAFDAAVAVAAALAVVEPYSSGIGGGGFFLLHRAADGRDVMVDARERAPLAATADLYLDPQGEIVPGRSLNGPLAAGIPGTPAGLAYLCRHYGRLSLSQTLAPAITYAEDGFRVSDLYRTMAGFRRSALTADATSASIFLVGGDVPVAGYVLKQPELAHTLARIAKDGEAGFYRGRIAEQLVAGVRAHGGIWSLEDLAQYRIVERAPVVGTYRGIRVVSAPPPSSGGVVLIEALNMLERLDLAQLAANTQRHVVIEVMRRAYRDRAQYLGDPDFIQVPVAELTAKPYAQQLTENLMLDRATPSSSLPPVVAPPQGTHTTHFSVLDTEGNRVAATLSVNFPFGAAFTPAGTGVLLNNEMDDFSARPLTPNGYGLVGDRANAIEPGKRPLSSMTPTFLETPERIGILGTPGGSRIISMVLLASLQFAAGGPPADWVGAPRYHHQFLPDEVQYEQGAFDADTIADLTRRGHVLREVDRRYGNMHAILWDLAHDTVAAASDPRGEGRAVVFTPPVHAVAK